MSERDDILRDLRWRLDDAREVCDALGLLDGPHGRTWLRQTRGVTVLCPWHDEHTPSCSVTPGSDGTLRAVCFGCDAKSDVFGLVAAVRGLDVRRDFPAVLAEAAGIAGVSHGVAHSVRRSPEVPRLPPDPPSLDDDVFDAIAQVILGHCPLAAAPDVCAYVAERGLLQHVAGWAALPANVKDRNAVRDAVVAEVGRDAWLRSGMALAAGERMGDWLWQEHRLVIPWRAPGVSGAIITLQRRLVRAARPGAGEQKYVFASRRPPRHPYGLEDALEELGAETEIAFVEGAIDVAALRAFARIEMRDRVVVGLAGVASWDPTWARFAVGRPAVIALDGDAAGNRWVETMRKDLISAGAASVRRIRPLRGKDWAEMLEVG